VASRANSTKAAEDEQGEKDGQHVAQEQVAEGKAPDHPSSISGSGCFVRGTVPHGLTSMVAGGWDGKDGWWSLKLAMSRPTRLARAGQVDTCGVHLPLLIVEQYPLL
jgi:hypothetical protein